jgi:hypothetical protein
VQISSTCFCWTSLCSSRYCAGPCCLHRHNFLGHPLPCGVLLARATFAVLVFSLALQSWLASPAFQAEVHHQPSTGRASPALAFKSLVGITSLPGGSASPAFKCLIPLGGFFVYAELLVRHHVHLHLAPRVSSRIATSFRSSCSLASTSNPPYLC